MNNSDGRPNTSYMHHPSPPQFIQASMFAKLKQGGGNNFISLIFEGIWECDYYYFLFKKYINNIFLFFKNYF